MLQFLLTFIILVLLTSFFICAWHRLTRHAIIIEPDNSVTVNGFILKWWSFYIEKIVKQKRIYYEGEALKEKILFLKKTIPSVYDKIQINKGIMSISLKNENKLTETEFDNMQRMLGCELSEPNDSNIFLFIEEPVYLLPEWFRRPISQCSGCMASFYGTIFYFTFLHLKPNFFSWSIHPFQCIFLFYVVFIVILFCLNLIIYRKVFEIV